MAGEITANVQITVRKNGMKFSRLPGNQSIDMTGDHVSAGTMEVGTSAEAIPKGDITTPGWIMAHNLDETNFVEIGYDDTGFKPTVKLLADEYALFRLTQATPQAKADTAACDMEYIMAEA